MLITCHNITNFPACSVVRVFHFTISPFGAVVIMRPKIGDRVLAVLNNSEVIEGTVEFWGNDLLEVSEIFCQTKNMDTLGNIIIYQAEVNNVKIIKEKEPTIQSGVDVKEHDNVAKIPLAAERESQKTSRITMESELFEYLNEMTLNYIYIDVVGNKFDQAITVLSDAENVAVAGLFTQCNTSRGLNLLVMCDFKNIYIFDVHCYRQSKVKRFRNIFENKYITKVVFDGDALYHALYHHYEIKMKNVFDIQISDALLNDAKHCNTRRSLSESIHHYYNLPLSLLSAAEMVNQDTVLEHRPLPKETKVLVSQLVAYLFPLRDCLMKIIMKRHIEAVNNRHRVLEGMSTFQFVNNLEVRV